MEKPIILLHGSWHGAWCWYKITPRLLALGYDVHVPDLPGHGREWRTFRGRITLGAMVKTVTDILDRLSQKAIVVVHSRSGIVASQAAELRPEKIECIAYLASFMLKNGERAADWFFSDKDSSLQGQIAIDRFRFTDMIKPEAYKNSLYGDCSSDDVALASALLTPEPSLPALKRIQLTEKNYDSIPRYYIELIEDRAISIQLQRRWIERQPVKQVFSLRASHSAYFSKPDELTQIIHTIATNQS